MESKDVVPAVRSGWLLVVGGLLAGVLVGWGLASAATPMYASTSRLLVWAPADEPAAALDAGLVAQQRATTYAEILGGRAIVVDVVERLGLDDDPDQLADAVDVVVVPEAILEVTVTHASAERARDIVAALGEQLDAEIEALEAQGGDPNVSPVSLRVLEPALVPDEPVSPVAARYYALGGLLGLLAGFAAAVLRHRRDTTVKDRDVLAGTTGGDVIGTVVHDRQLARQQSVLAGPDSLGAQSFRAMATRLQFADAGQRPRTIAVTSPQAGDGRTTIALNLAVALGRTGARVVVVETDADRPHLAESLGLDDARGLAEVLTGSGGWRDLAQEWNAPPGGGGAVTVLAAGSAPRDGLPLGGRRMRTLLADLREAYDFVVLDTPPLLAVADSAMVSALADGCVLAARYGGTRQEELAEAAATLARFEVRLLGVVLNGVPPGAAKHAGYAFALPRSARFRWPVRSTKGHPAEHARPPSAARPSLVPPRTAPQTEGGAT